MLNLWLQRYNFNVENKLFPVYLNVNPYRRNIYGYDNIVVLILLKIIEGICNGL